MRKEQSESVFFIWDFFTGCLFVCDCCSSGGEGDKNDEWNIIRRVE